MNLWNLFAVALAAAGAVAAFYSLPLGIVLLGNASWMSVLGQQDDEDEDLDLE